MFWYVLFSLRFRKHAMNKTLSCLFFFCLVYILYLTLGYLDSYVRKAGNFKCFRSNLDLASTITGAIRVGLNKWHANPPPGTQAGTRTPNLLYGSPMQYQLRWLALRLVFFFFSALLYFSFNAQLFELHGQMDASVGKKFY